MMNCFVVTSKMYKPKPRTVCSLQNEKKKKKNRRLPSESTNKPINQ